MLQMEDETEKKKVANDIKVASLMLEQAGGVSFAEEKIKWNAVNQLTKESHPVELPKMLVGGNWLGQNTDLKTPSPLVDKVQELSGDVCTVFQRLNDAGDMLRVCTNVPNKATGTRAIGTYIPATNPDGKPNPVLETVLRGETYIGRAFVVDDWYTTAYKPLFDKDKKVVGALFVGAKPENIAALRKGIMSIVPGKTGYVYILGGSGDQQGTIHHFRQGKTRRRKYLERQGRRRQACSFNPSSKRQWRRKTANAISNAIPGKIPAKTTRAMKIAAITYFKPWDWVIGVGTYEDDYHETLWRRWIRALSQSPLCRA